jgi:hypothetical protein
MVRTQHRDITGLHSVRLGYLLSLGTRNPTYLFYELRSGGEA